LVVHGVSDRITSDIFGDKDELAGYTMVATPEVASEIDRDLWAIDAALEDICDLADRWDEEPIETRIDWDYEWGQLMMFLVTLHAAYASGIMSAMQREQYHDLARRLRDALPLLQRLGLVEQFPVPLDTVTVAHA